MSVLKAFDDIIVVDWSAASVPRTGPDSCWVAAGPVGNARKLTTTNYSTRFETMRAIELRLEELLQEKKRTLVTFDVSFGFPAGAVKILGFSGKPGWRAMWKGLEAKISDSVENRNNRFEVADSLNVTCGTRLFWGRPVAKSFDHLNHLPLRNIDVEGLVPNPLPRLRTCETLAGPGVMSNWMLIGKGAVGGQVLTCLPYLEGLRKNLGPRLGVWPFDGLGDSGHDVVLAETWFGLFPWRTEPGSCRDEQQVRGAHKFLRSLDQQELQVLMTPSSLLSLSKRRQSAVLNEEGWTLGVS